MKILQERGFFGAGLVPVTTPLLVDRYNECLKAIGKEPTALKRFAIDGAGWSPQIASERNDPDYLCHGEANLYTIILTPDQQGKPVYMPMHSFDWKVLETIHAEHRETIHNLTGLSGIVLDIDQGIDEYHSPFDLLMLHSVVLKSSTPILIMDRAKEQRLMVARFRHEHDAYANTKLIEKLLESAKENGDLRHRSITLPEVHFSNVQNFYTRAMGGVFVFRNCPNRKAPIIVTEGPEFQEEVDVERNHFSLNPNPEIVLRAMENAGLLVRFSKLKPSERKRNIQEILDYLLARAIYQSGYKGDISELNSAQKKGIATQAKEHLPPSYKRLSDYLRALRSDAALIPLRTSCPSWKHSLIPNPSLDKLTSDVVWQLLCLADPFNIEMTYRHSKQQFYRLYQKWGTGQRKWAVHLLEKRGIARMK